MWCCDEGVAAHADLGPASGNVCLVGGATPSRRSLLLRRPSPAGPRCSPSSGRRDVGSDAPTPIHPAMPASKANALAADRDDTPILTKMLDRCPATVLSLRYSSAAMPGSCDPAFPDLQVTVHETLVDRDLFASRTTFTGTHRGDLMGLPPTGQTVTVEAIDIGRIEEGRAAERWGGLNMYALLVQLGVIPAPNS